ncbi:MULTISPECIES: copper amine oxidase N-terminal domain-containing protein [unclassified Fusibacter]|uniref:copper amine oxidase N-terminal domain-containing protein n=1 Tax=unclassified Fusibacter TaxID=2624464 RepID=UPI001011695A|nr:MULTISPECIES: copper amine oxidase N-terminal domain-containing protein [unclassified Fusibacter]MCK8059883.1 copper amine oxidase N-terminal domain-containing protein [Fusibacter sp. A2]NPE21685.1 copper amine oxidase N-terminal domain-containing protein [Fusibacter sp. A1]RXV62088.1 copper amine oxidase N-terminal domain-containing protein [Fusibacter sp. A1]
MFKKVISIIIAILLLQSAVFASSNTSTKNLTIVFDGSVVTFDLPAKLIDGEPMIPMREFFEVLGARVDWYGETRHIAAYRSNMYVKLQIGNSTAYRNGKSYALTHAPVILNSRTYLPAKFIAMSFDITYEFDSAQNKIILNTRERARFSYKNDIFFTAVDIDDYNMTISIPYGWKLLEDNTYGILDDYDDYKIAIKRYANIEKFTEEQYKNRYKQALIDTYGTKVVFSYDSTFAADDNTFSAFGYFLNDNKLQRFYDVYILEIDGEFYIFEGSYGVTTDETYIRDIYHTILDQMQLNAKTVESINEHYIEYPPFMIYGIHLDNEFTSNQEVTSKFQIKGSIKEHQSILKLYAVITKGDQRTSFNIPVNKTGEFDSFLYTPFGIGKHNIQLFAKTTDQTKDSLLLQFSAINLSSKVTRYLIPSLYAQSNTVEATSLTSFLTNQTTSSYLRAQAIYNYILTDVKLEAETLESLENIRTSNDVIIKHLATPLEANILLATLLRASDIPAKVYMGQIGTKTYYFVEAQINGIWTVLDPVTEKKATENPKLTEQVSGAPASPYTSFDQYFYINTTQYKNLMDGLQVLPY